MQQININELKPHPRNNEFFDDMSGEKWTEFLESIRTSGVIEPIVVTTDMTIVSGHQRVRACKQLGINSVLCEIKTYKDEDSVIKDLLETNIRQRGDVGGSAKKVGLRIKELERLYGVRDGAANEKGTRVGEINSSTQKDIADKLDIDVRTLQNYKLLAEIIPELEELLDTGIVTKTTALAIMKNLSNQEQEELISKLDVTQKYTQKQIQKYIDEMKSHEKENKNNDTEKLSTLKAENEKLENENKILEAQKKISDDLANQYKSQSEEYMEVKKKLAHMGLEPDGDYNTFQATVQITELNNELIELLQNKLAPFKYQSCIFAVKENELLRTNFLNTLEMLNDWYSTMLSYFGEETYEENIIDIEMEEN